MAFPKIRTHTVISMIIIIAGLFIGGFLLLFGIANLLDPDVDEAYYGQNIKVCLIVCGTGVLFLLLASATIRGILLKKKNYAGEDKT
jgi:hypothetical protein